MRAGRCCPSATSKEKIPRNTAPKSLQQRTFCMLLKTFLGDMIALANHWSPAHLADCWHNDHNLGLPYNLLWTGACTGYESTWVLHIKNKKGHDVEDANWCSMVRKCKQFVQTPMYSHPGFLVPQKAAMILVLADAAQLHRITWPFQNFFLEVPCFTNLLTRNVGCFCF